MLIDHLSKELRLWTSLIKTKENHPPRWKWLPQVLLDTNSLNEEVSGIDGSMSNQMNFRKEGCLSKECMGERVGEWQYLSGSKSHLIYLTN